MNENRRNTLLLPILLISLLIGVLLSLTFVSFASEESFKPKMSVTMSESLVFNLYVPTDERLTSLSLDGEVKNISQLPQKNGYYHIAVPLDANEADRDIKLSVKLTESGKTKNGSFTFSLAKYANKVLSGSDSETTKKLAKDILAYVNAAKVFFGEEPSSAISNLLGNYSSDFSPVKAENVSIGLKEAAFVLGAKPSVRFYIASGYSAKDFVFTRGNEVLSVNSGSDERGAYVEIFSYAFAMTETLSYTVKGVSGTGKYNLSSYCSWVSEKYAGNDKAELLDLAKKFYIYCESAAAYRREVIISLCDHDYTSAVKKKATPTEEGIMEYNCPKCEHTYEERIPTTLKLLAIGNSFSEDSFKHLYMVAKSAGIENVVLGNLYEGGCSLDKHQSFMSGNLANYDKFYVSSDEAGGMVSYKTNASAKDALNYTDWDYISLQQASGSSGKPDTYSNLQWIIDYVNANKKSDAKILWHMTWAYQQDSTHNDFSKYNNDQMTMYNSIVSTVQEKILTNDDISYVIPSGTAIQNLRTSELGDDTLTRDGYHLSFGIGRYTASLTWIAKITGCDVDKITATPADYPEVATYLEHIRDAVKKAIANPYEVTESAYPKVEDPNAPSEPEKLLGTTLSPLTAEDVAYLKSKGYSDAADTFMSLDIVYAGDNTYYTSLEDSRIHQFASTHTNYNKYIATQIFARNELITGSVIRIDSGYQYRPDGWTDLSVKNSTRPGNTSTDAIVVDDTWWGSYNYRGFNISKTSGTISTDDGGSFKIYVPIVKRVELSSEDRAYLTSKGLNPNEYMVLDFTYTVDAYYQSDTASISNVKAGTGNVKGLYVATQIFSKYDIALGSIIRIVDSTHKYRPEGWTTLSTKTSSRPGEVTDNHVVVDSAWWGNFNYRGFNIKDTTAKYTDASTYVTDEDASALRIYVPAEKTSALTAEDRAYLEAQGLNPDEYRVLHLETYHNSYYNSPQDSKMHQFASTSNKYNKYIATQIFTRNDLVTGSVIRINSGYQYRPEAWTDLSVKTPSRPGETTDDAIMIDDAWWGSYNYRGFNISKTSGTISIDEGENFKIYVKI